MFYKLCDRQLKDNYDGLKLKNIFITVLFTSKIVILFIIPFISVIILKY